MDKTSSRRLKQLAWILTVTVPCMLGIGFGLLWLKGALEEHLQMTVPGFVALFIVLFAMWATFWLTAGRIFREMMSDNRGSKKSDDCAS